MKIFNLFKTIWHKKEIKHVIMSDKYKIDDFKYKTRLEIRFQDFDIMGHVNNAVYLTYFEIGRTNYWKQAINWNWEKTGIVIGSATIEYILPIFLNEAASIYIRTSRIGTKSFDLEYIIVKTKENKEVICSKGTTVCVAFDYEQKKAIPIPAIERNKMIDFEQLEHPTVLSSAN